METSASDHVLIGIVIPAYNAASTLHKTLDAINRIKKTLQNITLYCVLIDDCSTDQTNVIANEFLEAGTINVYFRNKSNQGVSAARNIGISFCKKTDYIIFCDADDAFNLEGFREVDLTSTSDLILFNHYRKKDAENHLVMYQFSQDISKHLSRESLNDYLLQYLERPNQFSLWTSCWAKLFKTDIIVNNNINFDPQMKVFEDVKFNFSFLKHAASILYINTPIYTHYLASSKTYTRSATMGAHCTVTERFAFSEALNTLTAFIAKENGEDHSREIGHCLGAYSIITLIRACLTINSIRSFLLVRKQVVLILSKPQFIQAFKYYDAKKAGGNSLIPWLIKHKLYSLAIAFSCRLARKRYG